MIPSGSFLGNPLQDWLVAIGVAAVCYFALKLIRRIVVSRLGKMAQATETHIDDLAGAILAGTREWFLLIVSLKAGSAVLTFHGTATDIATTILYLAFFIQAGIWVTRGIVFLLNQSLRDRVEEDPASRTMLTPMIFLSRLVVWTIVLLLALDNFGVDVTALVTGLGVGGIAVALALQTVLGDLFAALAIVLDKPFVIGDFVVVDQFSGTIEHVGLKTTRIRSLSGEQIIVSNSDLLKSRVRNFKKMQERRALFTVGVTYQTPADQLAKIPEMIRSIIEKTPQTRFDRCHFKAYGESSLDFESVFYVLDPEYNVYMETQQAINLEIYRQFGDAGIEFAYPTRTLYIEKAGSLGATGDSVS